MAERQSPVEAGRTAESIEWHALQPREPRVRRTVALLAGLVVGGGATVAAVAALVASDLSRVAVAAGVLLAALPTAAALAWYRRSRERTPMADALAIDAAGVGWLPVAGAVAASLVLAVPWLGDDSAVHLALLAATVGAAGVLAVQTLRCSGRIDPEARKVTVEGRMYDLERAPTTSISLGNLTIVVVQRPASDPLERYDVFAMPTSVYRQAELASAGTGL